MDIRQHNWFSKRLAIDGGGSATITAMAAAQKWNLYAGVIGWSLASQSATVSLYEIDNTNSSAFFRFTTSTTNGLYSFFVGGVAASSTNTRLMLNVGGGAGTFTGMFTGWTTGG